MTIEAYMNPDFTWLQKLLFLLMAIGGLTICYFFIYTGVKCFAKGGGRRQRMENAHGRFHSLVHLFYEMLISAHLQPCSGRTRKWLFQRLCPHLGGVEGFYFTSSDMPFLCSQHHLRQVHNSASQDK